MITDPVQRTRHATACSCDCHTPGSRSGLITPAELAERLRGTVSVRTPANWRSQRRGPKSTRLGGRGVFYTESEVERWLGIQQARADDWWSDRD